MERLETLLAEVRACRACADVLPLGASPLLQAHADARILIAGQAPGSRAHASGVPFDDASGERLREWMGIGSAEFHDPRKFAIIPMGLCYPGVAGGGDAPPRPECAPRWRARLLARLPRLQLTLLVGGYAQEAVLGKGRVTDRVRDFESALPAFFALPHPSWRSRYWESRNPWFRERVVPRLRLALRDAGVDSDAGSPALGSRP